MTMYRLDIKLKNSEHIFSSAFVSETEKVTVEELLKECYRQIDASPGSNFVFFKRFNVIQAKDNIDYIKIV